MEDADYLKNVIVDAYESNCLLRPRKPVTKIYWWNNELEKLKSETRRRLNKARRTGLAVYWKTFRILNESTDRQSRRRNAKARDTSAKVLRASQRHSDFVESSA